jgi:predicted transcriptional regulator
MKKETAHRLYALDTGIIIRSGHQQWFSVNDEAEKRYGHSAEVSWQILLAQVRSYDPPKTLLEVGCNIDGK